MRLKQDPGPWSQFSYDDDVDDNDDHCESGQMMAWDRNISN